MLAGQNYMGKRIKQTDLAKATGISRRTLNRLVNNKVRSVDFSTLELLCNYFRCKPGDLLDLVPRPSSESSTSKEESTIHEANSSFDASSQPLDSQNGESHESSTDDDRGTTGTDGLN
jgi:putative transcriptional regulator